MPAGSMPPAVIYRPDVDTTRHRPAEPNGSALSRPHPAPQVTVTVAVTLTGDDAINAADDIEDGLWNFANGLSDGASVVTVATTVASVRSRDGLAVPDRAPARVAPSGIPVTVPPTTRGTATTPTFPPVTAPLRLFPASRIATLDGTPVQLTRREFDMLLHMARHPGRVFTRQQLSLAVWQEDFMRGERTIDVHIHRLRLKLAGRGPTITTVRGVGYRLDAAHRVWLAEETSED